MSEPVNISGPKYTLPVPIFPLPPAEEREKIPVQCDQPGLSQWAPAIAPPLGCREVSLAPLLFDEYLRALSGYSGNETLQRKHDRGQPLSAREKQIMAAIKNAEHQIFQYGVTLFSAAFLQEYPAAEAQGLWGAFTAKLKNLSINQARTNALLLLADDKLSIADRRLLLEYCTNKSGTITPALAERFAEHYRAVGRDYNGWQGGHYYSSGDAFIGVLAELLGPYDLEKLETYIFSRNPNAFLVRLNDREARQYHSLPKQDFFSRYEALCKDHLRTPPGNLKAVLFRKIRDLEVIALARGLSLEWFRHNDFARSLPGLSDSEISSLLVIDFYSRHITGRSNPLFKQFFEATLANFTAAFNRAPAALKTTYASALHLLDRMAFDFGLSAAEVDRMLTVICRRLRCSLRPIGQVANLAELKGRNNIAITPEGLPVEVKDILTKTGDWELVRGNLNSIMFSAKINVGPGIASLEAAGLATPILKMIEIDHSKPDGTPVAAWEIAAVLVHEAAHVAWRQNAPILQQTTIDERNAFVREHYFLSKHRALIGRSKEIDQAIDLAKKSVFNANQIIGYPAADLLTQTVLPPAQYYQGLGVSGPEEMDFSFYPAFPGPTYLVDRAQLAERLGGKTKTVEPKILGILAAVLNSQADLKIQAVFRADHVVGIPEIVVEADGETVKLPENEARALAALLAKAVINTELLDRPINSFSPLLAAADQLGVSAAPLSGARLQQLLQNHAPLDLAHLKSLVAKNDPGYNIAARSPELNRAFPLFLKAAGPLVKRLGANAYAAFLESLSIARKMIDSPELRTDAKTLASSALLLPADRAKFSVALRLSNALKQGGLARSEEFALIDLTREYLDLALAEEKMITGEYRLTAVSLRNFLFFSEP